jgi:hypothetical protein
MQCSLTRIPDLLIFQVLNGTVYPAFLLYQFLFSLRAFRGMVAG